MLKFLRYLWACPATLVGIVSALPFVASGGRARRVAGALEFSGGRLGHALRRFGFAAITFGHVIIGLDERCLHACRAHEHVHMRQYERWGLLFFPLYAASSAWAWMRGRDPYRDNAFEREAYGVNARRDGGRSRSG